jgi:hypothetical protein
MTSRLQKYVNFNKSLYLFKYIFSNMVVPTFHEALNKVHGIKKVEDPWFQERLRC